MKSKTIKKTICAMLTFLLLTYSSSIVLASSVPDSDTSKISDIVLASDETEYSEDEKLDVYVTKEKVSIASMDEIIDSSNNSLDSSDTDYFKNFGYVSGLTNGLTKNQESRLEKKISKIFKKTGCKTVILLDSDERYLKNEYLKDFYQNYYGGSGAILVITPSSAYNYIFFGGVAATSSYDSRFIEKMLISTYGDNDTYSTINTFIEITNDIYTHTENENNFNMKGYVVVVLCISITTGLISLYTSRKRSTKKTEQTYSEKIYGQNATTYEVPGSLRFAINDQILLRKTEDRQENIISSHRF